MRIAVGLEYDGTAYNGWQKQRSGIGVQEVVERALAAVANAPVQAHCAGRTDAGVHASAQVAHFDSDAARSERNWLLGVNSHLPPDVNALWVAPVGDDFHARYSAAARTYRYLILNRPCRSALWRDRAWWVHVSLDDARMRAAAAHLLGEHDFSAFRAAGCQARTPVRHVHSITVERCGGEWLAIEVTANAFLQHMVRNVVGTLAAVGRGEQTPEWVRDVLAGRDRTRGGMAAPSRGLTLVGVDYPATFGLPCAPETLLLPSRGMAGRRRPRRRG